MSALLILAGCATAPEPTRPVQDAPDRWSATAIAGTVESGWLSAFNDEQLLQLVNEAITRNHDLRITAAKLEEAEAAARKASAGLVPNVGVNLGAQRAGDNESLTQSDAGVSLAIGWEVDIWGRIRSGASAASARTDAAREDLAFARLSLAAQTAKAWLQAIEAGLQEGLAAASLEDLRETLRIVTARQREGLASSLDIHLVQTDLGMTASQLQGVSTARLEAVRSLELLLGRYPGAELEVRDSLPDLPAAVPAGLPAELLERRPDLRAAAAQVAAAFAVSREARAARMPRLSLTAAGGTASSALQSLIQPLDSFWVIGVNLFQPLIDGGRLRADVEIADARQQAAIESYANKALQAFAEVERSLTAAGSLQQRDASLRHATAEAHEAHRLATLRYQEGETDLLDVLAMHRRTIDAQQALYRVELEQLTERINLHLALGGEF